MNPVSANTHIGAHTIIISLTAPCEPYSEQACRDSATAQGLELGGGGHPFKRSTYQVKGCFAYSSGEYAGMAFFGSGGTISKMQTALYSDGQYRPKNYDCKSGGCTHMWRASNMTIPHFYYCNGVVRNSCFWFYYWVPSPLFFSFFFFYIFFLYIFFFGFMLDPFTSL